MPACFNMLRFARLIVLICLIPVRLLAQNTTPTVEFPLAFREEPAAPFIATDPGSGKSIAFFYPRKAVYADQYPCQAVELDTTAAVLTRIGPVGRLRIDWGWKSELSPLVACQDEKAAYFWMLDHLTILVVAVNKSDLSVRAVRRQALKSRDDILGALARPGHGLLLLKEKHRRNNNTIRVLRLQGDTLETIQSIEAGHLYGLFSKDFKPANSAAGLQPDPAHAANPFRLFDAGDTIRITHDGRFGPTGLETAYLRLYTFDLKHGKATLEELPYLPSGVQTGIAAQGASYIADGKLFQLYVTHAQWNLLVRDLATATLLHHEKVTLADSLPVFNAPVEIPANLIQDVQSNPVANFLQAHLKTLPFLFVQPVAGGYALHLGGSQEAANNLWLVPVGVVAPGAAVTAALFRRWSGQKSFSLFKTLVVPGFGSAAGILREKTFFQDCENLLEVLADQARRSAESVYQLGGKTYMGVYTVKSGQYGFYRVAGW